MGKGYAQPRHGHDAGKYQLGIIWSFWLANFNFHQVYIQCGTHFNLFIGDHPPITPVGLALPHELHSSDNARIYELVVRHFLATISPDALFQVTKAQFSAPLTGERFTLHGKKEMQAGFLNVYRTCVSGAQLHSVDDDEIFQSNSSTVGKNINSSTSKTDSSNTNEDAETHKLLELPPIEVNKAYRLVTVKFRQGATKPPGMNTNYAIFVSFLSFLFDVLKFCV